MQKQKKMNCHVLVVDCEEDSRRFMAKIIGSLVQEVSQVADAEGCLQAVRQLQPDIVVLNVGVGLIRSLIKVIGESSVSCRTLAVVSFWDEADEVAGADGVLAKPIMKKDLLGLLKQLQPGQ
ncbi:response regulator [Desulfurispirillum indicum]|uniref:Response regulator receiver n=1 Tax=Desulfurispirillum indicum (strain ATCC BAA-1389 / DSM 22839 / S5) TaxID=653733 RepID=E6W349_DESIS|nr:response regulator [Desulfurispirillum indicum]ADU65710.1 response regulator receiver [Desulfurispirillum indicum S5]UCZ57454.1 response regulator [Desulfurispirillum indicum]